MGKKGVDFFPLDCQSSEEIELLEAQFGIKGFAVIIKLYQRIFGNEGYYCRWDEDIRMLFSKQIGLNCTLVSDIVQKAIQRGIFSEPVYKNYGVLTSAWIQEKYFFAVDRRKSIFLKNEYLLVHCDLIPKNADISAKNVNTNGRNVDISTQSKVKETKVKKTKEDKAPRSARADVFADFAGDNKNLLSALKDFEEYRAKSKSKMTDRAKGLLIAELKKISSNSEEQIAIINQSILRGWKSVFPLRQDNKLTQQSNYYTNGERIGEHII